MTVFTLVSRRRPRPTRPLDHPCWAAWAWVLLAWVLLASVLLALLCPPAHAALGQTTLAPVGGDGPVTVYYPTDSEEQPVRHGPMTLSLAVGAPPAAGNGRLVVISHGSGGSPWVHADLARALVAAGFVVALPEHHADNYRDPSDPGPDSWKLRPAEVSRAIDAVAANPLFGPGLQLDRVGMYGMSAGGHTALSLAGGLWSPARFRDHCDADLAADFQSCVGLITRLTGGWLDGLRLWGARRVIAHRFSDGHLYGHTDPRIAAVVAGVPAAADFDPASLAHPVVPLGLVTAGQDHWLIPRFHSERVLAACTACEQVADVPAGGHGALLSPLPPGLDGLLGELLNDPPGFDRRTLAEVDQRIVGFFQRHLQP